MLARFRDVAVTTLMVVGTSLASARPAAAQGGYLRTDNLGYSGSVTCYSSLSGALNHSVFNCGTSGIDQRDLGVSFIDGNDFFKSPTQAVFTTNWYSNLGRNPSDNNLGFVQMYDYDGGSMTSMSTTWDDSRTLFTLAASGSNTLLGCDNDVQDCGVLWNGFGWAGGGTFISWDINAVFSGFTEATFNTATQMFESASEPVGVTGTLSGVFRDATTGLYYDLNATLNSNSWAQAHGFGTNTIAGALAPVTATPEPGSIALLATGLVGVGAFSLRRRRKQGAAS